MVFLSHNGVKFYKCVTASIFHFFRKISSVINISVVGKISLFSSVGALGLLFVATEPSSVDSKIQFLLCFVIITLSIYFTTDRNTSEAFIYL